MRPRHRLTFDFLVPMSRLFESRLSASSFLGGVWSPVGTGELNPLKGVNGLLLANLQTTLIQSVLVWFCFPCLSFDPPLTRQFRGWRAERRHNQPGYHPQDTSCAGQNISLPQKVKLVVPIKRSPQKTPKTMKGAGTPEVRIAWNIPKTRGL